jgi:hypothetical protein
MGQSIEVTPFIYPGVIEPWKMLLDIKEHGSSEPLADYMARHYALKGTDLFVGPGDRFVRPSYRDVRGYEEKYLPGSMQRDYENNPNVED